MSKSLLSDDEINEAVAALRGAFEALREIRRRSPGGQYVQFPKVPSIISESIAAREIRGGRAPFWKPPVRVDAGGKNADLLVGGNETFRVEVKATGSQGFQYLGPKDVTTDVIVWIHFRQFFESVDARPVVAYWLRDPRTIFVEPQKISIGTFRKRCGNRLAETIVRI